MKKVLWFSRHKMTTAQFDALKGALGEIELTQVSGSPANAHVPFEAQGIETAAGVDAAFLLKGIQPALKELVKGFDEVCVVLPVNMLQQLLPFAGSRLLQAVSKRSVSDTGVVIFTFDRWEVVKEVKIVTTPL
jgi:hypothetical protein